MTDDPIIDEVRRAREAYVARFNFDMAAVFADLRRGTEEAARQGTRVVQPPMPAAPVPPPDSVPPRRAVG